jgi:hypothetical protein
VWVISLSLSFRCRGEPNEEVKADKARTLTIVEVELERSLSLPLFLYLARSSPADTVHDMFGV